MKPHILLFAVLPIVAACDRVEYAARSVTAPIKELTRLPLDKQIDPVPLMQDLPPSGGDVVKLFIWVLLTLLSANAMADALSDLAGKPNVDINLIRKAAGVCKAEIDRRTGGAPMYGPCIQDDGSIPGVSITSRGYLLRFLVIHKSNANRNGMFYNSLTGHPDVMAKCLTDNSGNFISIESNTISFITTENKGLCVGQGQLY